MPTLNIKDPKVREMAISLAERRHTTATGAIRQALSEALEREDVRDREGMAERLMEIGRRAAARSGSYLTDDDLLDAIAPEVHAVDSTHLEIARGAWARFGRGSGSPARLNLGDCFSYAAAVATGEPLLFKGEDFAHTDIRDAREA